MANTVIWYSVREFRYLNTTEFSSPFTTTCTTHRIHIHRCTAVSFTSSPELTFTDGYSKLYTMKPFLLLRQARMCSKVACSTKFLKILSINTHIPPRVWIHWMSNTPLYTSPPAQQHGSMTHGSSWPWPQRSQGYWEHPVASWNMDQSHLKTHRNFTSSKQDGIKA